MAKAARIDLHLVQRIRARLACAELRILMEQTVGAGEIRQDHLVRRVWHAFNGEITLEQARQLLADIGERE